MKFDVLKSLVDSSSPLLRGVRTRPKCGSYRGTHLGSLVPVAPERVAPERVAPRPVIPGKWFLVVI
jgi:hypothetical protein